MNSLQILRVRQNDRLAKQFDRLQEQLQIHNAYQVDHHVERVLLPAWAFILINMPSGLKR